MERKTRILWVDDEMDLLKPYLIFLKEKGFEVSTSTNGDDAISMVGTDDFDLIFLDENMPGMSGIQTLSQLKELKPNIPVVMITKSEEEDIMEQAIGSKIADYLIKPVNPNQILLSIKKNIQTRQLISRQTTSDYQSQFNQITSLINTASSYCEWVDIYKKIVFWELELQNSENSQMDEILTMQKNEANKEFSRYIKRNYEKWFDGESTDKPLMSPSIFSSKVIPLLEKGDKVFFILIDNLRYDQWKTIEKQVTNFCRLDKEDLFCSILPTATQYSRNSMFAGLMPLEIYNLYPDLWLFDEEEGGKNLMEKELLEKHLARISTKFRFRYEKVTNQRTGKKLVEKIADLLSYDLNVIIYNFVDMLSHARTEMEMIRELADNEAAYRSLTASWFDHSNLFDLLKQLSGKNIKVIITTDHGSIRVQNPVKVIGDRKTSTNLRYKLGRNLNYEKGEVFEIRSPEKVHLPKSNISSSYIFACQADYLVYPNNYNHFVNFYKNTFQHGGVSMEEMLIPLIQLTT